jgi:spermidine synthase
MRYIFYCAASVATFFVIVSHINAEQGTSIKKERNFYGVLEVRSDESETYGPFRFMRHGLIKHGVQFQNEAARTYPTAYFYPESGVGTALLRHPRRAANKGLKIGIIGLGVGVLSAYGQPADEIFFYEIDPYVHTLANEYFSYLEQCPAQTHVFYGDGRLLLQEEFGKGIDHNYDVFIVDAFSGGTIPVHLLTKEAFALYDHHLEPKQGIIALHITNKFVNLVPQIKSVADELGFRFVIIETRGNGIVTYDATWAIMTRDEKFIKNNFVVLTKQEDIEGCALWTDNYSNLLAVLK